MTKKYADPVAEIEYCLRVGGSAHGEVLRFMLEYPVPWSSSMLFWEGNKTGKLPYEQITIRGGLDKLKALGAVAALGRKYVVDYEVVHHAKETPEK